MQTQHKAFFFLDKHIDIPLHRRLGNVCALRGEAGGAADASQFHGESPGPGGFGVWSSDSHHCPDQVTEEINKKVANKVVVGLGLCLALYDITEIGESFIFPGDSATHTKVQQFS